MLWSKTNTFLGCIPMHHKYIDILISSINHNNIVKFNALTHKIWKQKGENCNRVKFNYVFISNQAATLKN